MDDNTNSNIVISLGLQDILTILFCSLATAFIISIFQKRPTRPIGIMDFILGNHSVKYQSRSIFLFFLLPVLLGILIGLFNLSSAFIGGLGIAIGALITVSTAFLNPNLLSPPLQKQLNKARFIYTMFILSYGLLGMFGSFLSFAVPKIISENSVLVNIYSNILGSLYLLFGTLIIPFVRSKYRNSFKMNNKKDNSNRSTPKTTVREIAKIEIGRIVDEVAATTDQTHLTAEQFREMFNSEMQRQLPQIVQIVDLVYQQGLIRNENYRYYQNEQHDEYYNENPYYLDAHVFSLDYYPVHFTTEDSFLYGSDIPYEEEESLSWYYPGYFN